MITRIPSGNCMGHFKHANAYKLSHSLFERYDYLTDIFALADDGLICPLYEPPFAPPTLQSQYIWASGQYEGYCVFFQVGRFCEFYGDQAVRYGRFFGLRPQLGLRVGGMQCGFPMRNLKTFKARALQASMPYVVIGERGYYPSGLKKRVVTEIFRSERRTL